MLSSLRQNASGWIAKIFIGLLVISFAVWGVADVFHGGAESTVANIGDTEISAEQFQNEYRQEVNNFGRQFGQQLSAEQARQLGIDQRVLNRLITTAVLDQSANNLKLSVSEEAIADSIVDDPNFRGPTGDFSKLIFEQVLRQNGLSEPGYIALQKQATVRNQITQTIATIPVVPSSLLGAVNQYVNEKRSLRYFKLPIAKADALPEPASDSYQKFYDANKRTFTAPEYRKLSVLTLRPEDLAESIEVTDKELTDAFEDRKNTFGKAEQRTVQQISFKDAGAANEGFEKLKSGTDFLDLAKELGFTESDIDLGTITKAALADEKIAAAAFQVEEGKFSEPVVGSLNTVILRVTKIEPEVVKTFDDVKDELKKTLAREKAENELLDIQDNVEDTLASGATLQETADKLNITHTIFDAVDVRGNGRDGQKVADFPVAPGLLNSAFRSDIDVENDPLEVSGGGLLWFKVLDIMPEALKPFETVKDDVAKAWKEDEERKALLKLARSVVDRANKGETFADLAGEYSAEIKTSDPLKRNEDNSDLPRAAVLQAFALGENGVGSAAYSNEKARVVFQVHEIQAPEKQAAKDEEQTKQQLVQQFSSDFLSQYISGLRNDLGVSINRTTFDALVGGQYQHSR